MLKEEDNNNSNNETTDKNTSLGSKWSAELSKLRHCGSSYEASICLKQMTTILNTITNRKDRINFCQHDFNVSISILKTNPLLWNEHLHVLVRQINSTYFTKNYFQHLSVDVMEEIIRWLPINEFAPVLSVCQEWYKLGTSNNIWKQFYYSRFLRSNPTSSIPTSHIERHSYYVAFKIRLSDPQIGDKIEVAWKGKFRLEASEIYRGSAWWIAEVVERNEAQRTYKVRYPGWDARWDEVVHRNRLRWAVESNIVARVRVGDAVEV